MIFYTSLFHILIIISTFARLKNRELATKKPYTIAFKGLKNGTHYFDFEAGNAFFKEFEMTDMKDGLAAIDIELEKTDRFLDVSISIIGTLEVMCDRCLEYFKLNISYYNTFMVKFSETPMESTDEIMILHPNDHELNLKQYIFESISLSIPCRKVHPDDEQGNPGCNQDMLGKIKALKPKQLDEQSGNDPRWDILKDISIN